MDIKKLQTKHDKLLNWRRDVWLISPDYVSLLNRTSLVSALSKIDFQDSINIAQERKEEMEKHENLVTEFENLNVHHKDLVTAYNMRCDELSKKNAELDAFKAENEKLKQDNKNLEFTNAQKNYDKLWKMHEDTLQKYIDISGQYVDEVNAHCSLKGLFSVNHSKNTENTENTTLFENLSVLNDESIKRIDSIYNQLTMLRNEIQDRDIIIGSARIALIINNILRDIK